MRAEKTGASWTLTCPGTLLTVHMDRNSCLKPSCAPGWAQQGWEQEMEVSAPCSPSEGGVTWAAARAARGQALEVKEVFKNNVWL